MPKRPRQRAAPQSPQSPSCPSPSSSTHPASQVMREVQSPSLVPTPAPAPTDASPSVPPSPRAPSPSSPPTNATWLTRDPRPWSILAKPVEPALPTLDTPISAPRSLKSPTHPPCALSHAPSRPPSVMSYSSHSSTDSGVLLQLPPSKSSNVTSISIPPSVGSTRVCPLPSPLFCQPPITCHAPQPIRRVSGLSNVCEKKTRHSLFYFTNDLITLNVDGCLFRVHKGFLERESSYFRKLFVKEAGRGISDDTAIELPQVTAAAFETLLKFVYFGTHEPCSYPVEDWISLLAGSTALSFSRIRERALAELESEASCLDAVDRLLLAERYDVDHWRAPAYVQLCTRDRPIQESEATLLGVKVTSQLAEIREKMLLEMLEECQARSCQPKKSSSKTWPKPSRDVRRAAQMVEEVFWPHEVPISCRS